MTAELYRYWSEELASPGCNARDTDRRDLAGFWRLRAADTKPDWPLAIWPLSDDNLIAKIGNRQIAEGSEQWNDMLGSSWYKAVAVHEKDYRRALVDGRWPDDGKPARAMDKAEWHGVGIGHNQPDDPCEALRTELAGEVEQAEAFLKEQITTKEQADRAAAWAKKLTVLANKADEQRKVEKQPHLDAGRAVDDKWREIIEGGKDWARRLKKHMDGWLRKQAQIEAERQQKALEEAEKARREAEEKARLADAEEARSSEDAEAAKAEAEAAAQAAAQAAEDAKAKSTAAGRTGAKVGLRTWITAEITDYDALIAAIKDDKQIREYAVKRANAAAEAGNPLPGTKRVETQSVYKPEPEVA